MLDKITDFFAFLYVKAQIEMNKLKDEEDGMEIMEAVILIAIAVVIAGIVISALKGPDGLVAQIFNKIKTQIDNLFSSNNGN